MPSFIHSFYYYCYCFFFCDIIKRPLTAPPSGGGRGRPRQGVAPGGHGPRCRQRQVGRTLPCLLGGACRAAPLPGRDHQRGRGVGHGPCAEAHHPRQVGGAMAGLGLLFQGVGHGPRAQAHHPRQVGGSCDGMTKTVAGPRVVFLGVGVEFCVQGLGCRVVCSGSRV